MEKTRKRFSLLVSAAMALGLALALPLLGQSAHAQAVLINDDFEVSYDGWAEVGDFTVLTAHGGAAYNSGRGMEVTGRRLPADGAFSEKGFYLDGGEAYDYSVFVRHKGKAAETFNLALRWLLPDGRTYGSDVIASTSVQPNQWTSLTAKYAAPEGSVNLTLFINTNSAIDFCFDEFVVTGDANSVLRKSAKANAGEGLKDVYAKRFLFGTCIPSGGVNNSTNTALILREFNSLTPENELKPDATIQQANSTDTDVRVTLSRAASILNFAVQNNLSVRGHTLVWHSQTPVWFFRQGFQQNGANVSVAVMDQRMESYIKNMFAAIAQQYPTLKLYAYDVVNEAASENGSYRTGGSDASSGQSMWVQIYGNNSFIEKAFTQARKYAPASCALYYNDYNEYIQAKRDYIANSLVKPLFDKKLLDGMGMQAHLDVRTGGNNAYPSVALFGQAVTMYRNIGCNVQVTELDATVDNQNFTAQATYYRDIMNEILTKGGTAVNSVTIWGTMDNMSWRSSRTPLLFAANTGAKKPAYDAIFALIPQSEWGTTSIHGDNKNAARAYRPSVAVKGRTLAVNAPADSKMRIRVVNLTGRTVAVFNTKGGASISLRKIPAGTYVVEAKGVRDGARTVSTVVLK